MVSSIRGQIPEVAGECRFPCSICDIRDKLGIIVQEPSSWEITWTTWDLVTKSIKLKKKKKRLRITLVIGTHSDLCRHFLSLTQILTLYLQRKLVMISWRPVQISQDEVPRRYLMYTFLAYKLTVTIISLYSWWECTSKDSILQPCQSSCCNSL